jgi:hypothetical protein
MSALGATYYADARPPLPDPASEPALCSGVGQYHSPTAKTNPRPLDTICMPDVLAMLDHPQQVEKDQAQWFIPSTLASRCHADQRKHGVFHCLWSETDEPSGTLRDMAALVADAIGAEVLAYTTRSATEDRQKSRFLIPLAEPVSGQDFVRMQEVLNEHLQACGVPPDRASERAGQLCYLPNRGAFYDAIHLDHDRLHPSEWREAVAAIQEREQDEQEKARQQREASRLKARERAIRGGVSPIDAMNAEYRLEDVLPQYGYRRRGNRWLSPLSESGVAAVILSEDGRKWISSHGSDAAAGLGRECTNGCMGDVFDLYCHFEHGGDRNKALEAAAKLFELPDVVRSGSSSSTTPAAGTGKRKESDKPPQDGEAIMQPISARELFAMEFGEMIWNIQDILPAGTTLAFGKPKKGKSFLVLMIAISIAANRPVFGRRTSGCRVLYLGLEDSKRRLQRRAKGCAASLGIDPDEFVDRLHLDTRSARIDTGLLDELRDWMQAHPDTGVIVLDMLKKVTGATAGKSLYDEQSKVGDALTAFSHDYPALSIIVVHHSRKAESDDPFDLVSGTTGLSGSYDSLAAIADTEGARVLHLTGRDIEGAEIPLLMNDRGMYTLAMPNADEQATASMSDTRRRVFDAVPKTTAQSRAAIVEDAGLDRGIVDQQLRKLKRDGLIKVVDHGMYQKTGKRWFDDPVVDFDAVIRNASRL